MSRRHHCPKTRASGGYQRRIARRGKNPPMPSVETLRGRQHDLTRNLLADLKARGVRPIDLHHGSTSGS